MTEIKTEFEPLRRYKMKGGGVAKVSRIHPIGPNNRFPVGFFIERDHHGRERWATATGKHRDNGTSHALDLLLPAIEAEGAPAPALDVSTVDALKSYKDFWGGFRDAINAGIVDPTDGGEWPEWDQDAVIGRTYQTAESALIDCAIVINTINSLLEGAAK